MKRNYVSGDELQGDKFFYLFQKGSEFLYFSSDRYLTKGELQEIERAHGVTFKAYVTPVERLCEFSICHQFEEAIEKFLA